MSNAAAQPAPAQSQPAQSAAPAQAAPAAPAAPAVQGQSALTAGAEAGKPAEPAKPAVPEKYELKLPEKSGLGQDAIEKVAAFAKERGLSQEQAQAILERDSAAVGSFAEAQKLELQQKSTEWAKSAEADKEYGGQYFKENIEISKRAVEKYASPELKQLLDSSGLGNHPEVIRHFYRVGRADGEDRLALPGVQAGSTNKSLEDRLYGGDQT